MTENIISGGRSQRKPAKLTGVTEICRFSIWSPAEDGTKTWCNVNDAIVFQVNQLVIPVSRIRLSVVTGDELTAPSVVLHEAGGRQHSEWISKQKKNHPLNHDMRV